MIRQKPVSAISWEHGGLDLTRALNAGGVPPPDEVQQHWALRLVFLELAWARLTCSTEQS